MEATQTQLELHLRIDKAREGQYFTLPFDMPAGVEALTLSYHYERYSEKETRVGAGSFTARLKTNAIDLGLIAPGGGQVGASGSDKTEIYLSETQATPGYRPCALTEGPWEILVGAYKVAPEGVNVTYRLSFTPKRRRLLKGDLHTHTLASDGVHTVEELGRRAARHGLDFLAISDHNQMLSPGALPHIEGLTLIPGVEWTHYLGHANFLGVERPYDASFAANTPAEALACFRSARERGALITINHPFEAGMEFKYDLETFPYDCLEVWNGPMRESNLRALAFWHSLLAAGKKLPICGGSDFHRDSPFLFPGGPTTCVHACSSGPSDILSAVRRGRAYVIFAPNGPTLELNAGEAIPGDSVAWSQVKQLHIAVDGLAAGDVLRVVTGRGSAVLLQAPSAGRFSSDYNMAAPGFARVEVLRSFIPGVPPLPALISNPIYFEEG